MPVYKTDLECPLCQASDAAAIYRNISSDTNEEFFLFKCFSGNHGDFNNNIPITDPNNYLEEIKNEEEFKMSMTDDGGDFEDMGGDTLDDLINAPTKSEGNRSTPHIKSSSPFGLLQGGVYRSLTDHSDPWGNRGINEDTCAYYGVTVHNNVSVSQRSKKVEEWVAQGNSPTDKALAFPYYNTSKELIVQKVRTPVEKKGSWYKSGDNSVSLAGFFGQQLFNADLLSEIIITFGEFDALAAYQMLGGRPVVSVTNGDDSAQNQFRSQYHWLNKFDRIILVPDNDDACRRVVPLLGAIFPRKIRIVNLTQHKDPCDYLKNGKGDLFRKEFYAAQPHMPEKIVTFNSLRDLVLEQPPEPVAEYPFDGLNRMLGGIYPGDLITIKAFPKIGKTSTISKIVHHLLKTSDDPVGLIYLEETQQDLVYRFVTLELGANMQIREVRDRYSDDELLQAFDNICGGDDGKLTMLDHFGSCSSDYLEEKMKELVLARGCQFIFFDHVSMAISDESNKDERLALDRLIYSIKSITTGVHDEQKVQNPDGTESKEIYVRQPSIFMVTHVNDDGRPRGSRVSVQACNTLISLERDKTADDAVTRNTTNVVVEENRRFGLCGTACKLHYDHMTGDLTELELTNEEQNGISVHYNNDDDGDRPVRGRGFRVTDLT